MHHSKVINVTKTFLPPLAEFTSLLENTWETRWVTNQGPLAEELEKQLKEYLGVKHILLVANGTIALQLAIRALSLKGEIITTPYSYAATATSIMWEHCTPVFCDIEPDTFCIDAEKIVKLITPATTGILPTHVYGFPCNTGAIAEIARNNGLKVIYDGAHAFGVKHNGKSLLSEGDITAVSFHATKLFHTIEGGAVITDSDEIADRLFLYRAFGHKDDDYISIGINARNSELHSAIGLCNLKRVPEFIGTRRQLHSLYRGELRGAPVSLPEISPGTEYNYSYFPVLAEDESAMEEIKSALAENNVFARRYFYPSLNTLSYLNPASCPVSEDVASRILCLPLYHELEHEDVARISRILRNALEE